MARLHALKAAALARQEGESPGGSLPKLTVSPKPKGMQVLVRL